jgi:hypothetical protein
MKSSFFEARELFEAKCFGNVGIEAPEDVSALQQQMTVALSVIRGKALGFQRLIGADSTLISAALPITTLD